MPLTWLLTFSGCNSGPAEPILTKISEKLLLFLWVPWPHQSVCLHAGEHIFSTLYHGYVRIRLISGVWDICINTSRVWSGFWQRFEFRAKLVLSHLDYCLRYDLFIQILRKFNETRSQLSQQTEKDVQVTACRPPRRSHELCTAFTRCRCADASWWSP